MNRRALFVAAFAQLFLLVGAVEASAHEEGPSPYRWVSPPSGNHESPPEVAVSRHDLGQPSSASSATMTDGQLELGLAAGALPPRAGERAITLRLVPLDPATLPRVPAGSVAEGNAYLIEAAYADSGSPLTQLAMPAVLTLVAPSSATRLLRLSGSAWTLVPTVTLGEEARTGLIGRSSQLGTFVLSHDAEAAKQRPQPAAPSPVLPSATPVAAAPVAATSDPMPVAAGLLVALGIGAAGLLVVVIRRRTGE